MIIKNNENAIKECFYNNTTRAETYQISIFRG